MAWQKSLFSLTVLSIGVSLELATLAIGSAQAGVSNSISQRNWQISQFNPPDRGAPSSGVGGASRGGDPLCNEVAVLSPQGVSPNGAAPYFGLTVSPQPSFLFYVKGTKEYRGEKMIFILTELNGERRTDDRTIYETTFNLPDQAGTIGINLPSNVVLEEGKKYEWYMELIRESGCFSQPEPTVEAAWMSGFVERVEATPTLQNDLARAKTATERSKVYANAGMWFDALNVLAQERSQTDTPELENSWKALLQNAAIENAMKNSVLNAELIDCCSVESASDPSGLTTDR